jgi:hypothetical protein
MLRSWSRPRRGERSPLPPRVRRGRLRRHGLPTPPLAAGGTGNRSPGALSRPCSGSGPESRCFRGGPRRWFCMRPCTVSHISRSISIRSTAQKSALSHNGIWQIVRHWPPGKAGPVLASPHRPLSQDPNGSVNRSWVQYRFCEPLRPPAAAVSGRGSPSRGQTTRCGPGRMR